MVDGSDCYMIINASGIEIKIVIHHASGGSPETSIIFMRDDTNLTARRYRYHFQVERVVDTQHVWIDGITQEEIYVLDIDSKEVVTLFGENKKEIDKRDYIPLDTNGGGIGVEEDESILNHDKVIYYDAYNDNNGIIDLNMREIVGTTGVVFKRKDKVCPNMVSEVVDAPIHRQGITDNQLYVGIMFVVVVNPNVSTTRAIIEEEDISVKTVPDE